MVYHRPKFMVSKNEATRKLINAVKRGNLNSAKRQFNRGANVTVKNVRYNTNNNNLKYTNLYNLIRYGNIPNNNVKKQLYSLIANKGYNVATRNKEIEEALEKNRQNKIKEEEYRKKLRDSIQETRMLRRLRKNYKDEQERLRPVVLARKRLTNMNTAMTYKNGKPEGLSIKIPKNRTRRVHFYNNTIAVENV